MKLVSLGDQAVLAYLADEAAAIRLTRAIRTANPPWLHDVVPAYASVGVFFDADQVKRQDVFAALTAIDAVDEASPQALAMVVHQIPVCYEMAPDLERVANHARLDSERVIAAHLSVEYTVFAVGFVPGFPYLGYLPASIAGVPRLESPRVRVEPGSVGVAGKQTGLYPLPRPGGWNLIGRTPLTVVDVADGFFPIRVGDRVRFSRIDERAYGDLLGERLSAVQGRELVR